MLHILWMLIKLILILLGSLIGIVLLALLLVLFCPVRYRVDANKPTDDFKDVFAVANVSWLFHGVSFQLEFHDGKLSKDFRIFGIRIMELLKKLKERKRSTPVRKKTKTSAEKNSSRLEKKKNQEDLKLSSTKLENEESKSVEAENSMPDTGRALKDSENDNKIDPAESEESAAEEEVFTVSDRSSESEITSEEKEEENKKKLFEKVNDIIQKILDKLKKIPETVHKIKLTIKNIYDKIDWWKTFLNHPKVRAAISLVKDELIRLLKHVFPTKIKGKVTFGSEDPSTTGTVLAVLGMTMPFHKNKVQVTPVFDGTNIIEGHVMMKGRIYGIFLVIMVLKVYFNKNIKYIIHRLKHKEE